MFMFMAVPCTIGCGQQPFQHSALLESTHPRWFAGHSLVMGRDPFYWNFQGKEPLGKRLIDISYLLPPPLPPFVDWSSAGFSTGSPAPLDG